MSGGERPAVDPLTRLAIGRGTDKWGPHFYTPVYHELFQHLRERPIRFLEIGVGGHAAAGAGGASLLMWADYFPHASLVGIDIAEKQLDPHPRITVLRGSQDDAGFLSRVVADHGPFDIVIDDGSHVPAQVLVSFNLLFPAMTDRGLYVVEDVQTAYWPRFGGSLAGAETMALARSALDALNHAEIQAEDRAWVAPAIAPMLRSMRAYHNLLVFEKGDNREPSTRRYDPANAHAAAAIATMEDQLTREPTPAGLAQLARTYIVARRYAQALDVVQRGLDRWPRDVRLLMAGAKAARRIGDDRLRAQYLGLAGVPLGETAEES